MKISFKNHIGIGLHQNSHYTTFGSPIPGRQFTSSSSYRYGFNGKENDNEVKGEGNSVDFGARIYDPRIGRFLSVDPDADHYPYMSPYCYADNSPIKLIDEEGRGPRPPQNGYRNSRPIQRNPNWLETQNQINRSNYRGRNRGTFMPEPFPFRVYTIPEEWTGEVNAKYPYIKPTGPTGPYNAFQAMQMMGKIIGNAQEYFEKTTVVEPFGYDANGAYQPPLTVTKIFVVVPQIVQDLEKSYQAALKGHAQGKLTDEEFKQLPIEKQTARYSAAKVQLGQSPQEKFHEIAKKYYENPELMHKAKNKESSMTSGQTTNASEPLKSVTTYH